MAWSCLAGTRRSYQSKLRQICALEDSFSFPILRPTVLLEHGSSPDIPLMWCIEASSTRFMPHKSRGYESTLVSFTTVRQLCSAATSQYLAWDFLVAHPFASDWLIRSAIFLTAMSSRCCPPAYPPRMGTDDTPSLALLEWHVKCLDTELEHQLCFAMN